MKETESSAGAGGERRNDGGDDCNVVLGLANIVAGKATDSSDSRYEEDGTKPVQVPIEP